MMDWKGRSLLPLAGFLSSCAVCVCIVVGICLLSVQSYAGASVIDGYKKTAELTDKDCSDAHQKNYQQADKSTDTNFLYKMAEWTNKQKGDAKITLTARQTFPREKRTAVYAFNMCEQHGFRKDIAKRNIDFLLKNFDRVDIVRTGVRADETIYIKENIKSFKDVGWPTLEELIAADVPDASSGISNSHRNVGLYDGLRRYLKDNKPTCIYVSFDMFYAAQVDRGAGLEPYKPPETYMKLDEISEKQRIPFSEVPAEHRKGIETSFFAFGLPETMDEDCFDILQRYKREGRYFSMACNFYGEPVTKDGGYYGIGGSPKNSLIINKGALEKIGRERFFYSANIVAALADPSVWPGREAAKKGLWNGVHYDTDLLSYEDMVTKRRYIGPIYGRCGQEPLKGVAPDYPYSSDFEALKIPTAKHSLRMTDTVADAFKIVEVTSESPKVKIKIDGNAISALQDNYDGSASVTITIKATLKDLKKGVGKWIDTNEGPGKAYHLVSGKEAKTILVNPPKLFIGDNPPNQKVPPVTLETPPPTPPVPNPPEEPEPPAPVPPAPPVPNPPEEPEPPAPVPPPTPPRPNPPKELKPPAPVPPTTPPRPNPPKELKPPAPVPPTTPPRPNPPKQLEPPKSAPQKPVQMKSASPKLVSKATSTTSKRLPGTEDATNPWMWMGIGVLGVVGIAGALYMRKKKGD